MIAYIIENNGTEHRLPPLLAWETEYASCDACGAFSVKFLYDAKLGDALHAACAFRAEQGEKTVFTGIIDEYKVSAGSVGVTAELSGRSAEAVLMDNECEAASYGRLTLSTLVKTYVEPFFKGRLEVGENVTLRSFTVTGGQSAWAVLCRFLLLASLPRPVCTPDGTLYIGTLPPEKTVSLPAGSLDSAELLDRRYGLVSEYTVINRIRSRRAAAANEDFLLRGGSARRVLYVDRNTELDTMKKTAQERVEASGRNKHTVTVKTPALFAALPGDTVEICEKLLGLCGEYRVTGVRVFADEYRSYTELCAEVGD